MYSRKRFHLSADLISCFILATFIIITLAACEPQPAIIIPTLMQLPTAEPTSTAEPVTAVAALPPTWTPTDAPTSTPTATDTPMPTATETASITPSAPATTTPTPSLTPTAQGDAFVSGANGVNLRPGPGRDYQPPLALLPPGTELHLIGRTETGSWFEVETLTGLSGWVSANLIEIRADAPGVPVTFTQPPTQITPYIGLDPTLAAQEAQQQPPPAPISTGAPVSINPAMVGANSEYLFSVSQRTRQIYQQGQTQGNRANVFSKVGDSITASQPFLLPFSGGDYDLGQYGHLHASIDYFSGSFAASSMAASSAFNAAAVLSSIWADESRCQPNESPLACEYRLTRPAFAVIMLGSVDVQIYGADVYRQSMQAVVDLSIARGVVPILTTFPNGPGYYDSESETFNAIIRDIAAAEQIPLINLRSAAQRLPNNGCGSDRYHLSAGGNRLNFTGEEWEYGLTLRNLLTLQALDLLRRELS